MEYRRFGSTIIARFDRNEEISEQLKALALKEHITLGSVQGLGAVNDVTMGVFYTGEQEYHSNHFTGDFEIVSLHGTMTTQNGEYYGHYHISVGDKTGQVMGGHLNQAVVSATCEVVVTILDGTVERQFSKEIGLNLMNFL